MVQHYLNKKHLLSIALLTFSFVASSASADEFKCYVKGQDQGDYVVLIDTDDMKDAMRMADNALITRDDSSKVGVAEIMECAEEHNHFRHYKARSIDKELPR